MLTRTVLWLECPGRLSRGGPGCGRWRVGKSLASQAAGWSHGWGVCEATFDFHGAPVPGPSAPPTGQETPGPALRPLPPAALSSRHQHLLLSALPSQPSTAPCRTEAQHCLPLRDPSPHHTHTAKQPTPWGPCAHPGEPCCPVAVTPAHTLQPDSHLHRPQCLGKSSLLRVPVATPWPSLAAVLLLLLHPLPLPDGACWAGSAQAGSSFLGTAPE